MLQDILVEWGAHEVTPMEAYTDIFKLGEGYIQRSDEPSGEFKANPIGYYRDKDADHGHFRVFFEDTFEETLKELQEATGLSLLNGITYFGRKNVQDHASKMFAMIFDLDGVTEKTLNAFFSGAIFGNAYPFPNYIALSGHGVHLYYVFEEPISLYPYTKIQLKDLKFALTERLWNPYTSTEEKVQHQGINQGFRALGAETKENSTESRVRVFRVNTQPFTLNQLCEYVPDEYRVDQEMLWKESKYTLAQAKRKFPEWYQKVVVEGDKSPTYWDIAGKVNGEDPFALYHWWMRQIRIGASYRHRYFSIMALAIYGAKNDVPEEQVRQDAFGLVPFLNSLNPDEPFTEGDCEVALECFDARYKTFPIKDIEKITGIPIPRNKRNGRKQSLHLRLARATRDILCEERGKSDWREGAGRPKGSGTAQAKVAAYRAEHPEVSVTEVARALNISRPTVYKWWDAKIQEPMGEQFVPYQFTPDGAEPMPPNMSPKQWSEAEKAAIRKFINKKHNKSPHIEDEN